ncbi:MAG: type III pantothenate kinase [Chitinophagaceae bacterium]|nr:MAG: type III pantothenate kinase [Chitinophagaceae bacterium]
MFYTTLCLDFGNTRRKAALFRDGELAETFDLDSADSGEISFVLDRYTPDRTILSSVISHDDSIEEVLKNKSRFHKLSYETRLNFVSPVAKPQTIGADRLALAAAAVHYFPNMNNLVIGLGSCITYNFINQYHQFLGGAISPGKKMRFKAMHEFTAKLPLAEASWNFPLVGYDTSTNLQCGVLAGMAAEIEGMIAKYSEKYGNFNVVLTGGDSAYFATQVKREIFADFNFLFKGLYAISEINNAAP